MIINLPLLSLYDNPSPPTQNLEVFVSEYKFLILRFEYPPYISRRWIFNFECLDVKKEERKKKERKIFDDDLWRRRITSKSCSQ